MALMWTPHLSKELNSSDHLLCAESSGESEKSDITILKNLTVFRC